MASSGRLSATIGLGLLAVLLTASCSFQKANAQASKPSFNYTQGGADWGSLCVNGSFQSPINVRTARATVNGTIGPDSSFVLQYERLSNYTIVNKGQTIEFEGGENNNLTLPTAIYKPTNGTSKLHLLQSHFHEPSEHLREGVAYPLEQHFVHNDAATGRFAVLAVFYKIDDEEVPNPFLSQILNYAPGGYNNKTVVTNQTIDLPAWIPINSNYFHYNGSLTTPPCTEGIMWFVLDTPLTMSSAQLTQYQRLTFLGGGDRGDNRPLQRVGTRELQHWIK
ncbi:hypothetical protein KFL_001350080 [Klebsormidium nitens]|uniref:carbonic anhydrase n=1 Tax=Klebsormidium nitens TaxID=105231 RepID=A0A1Y1HWQ7_KLENI|nr:hypothetical protein KFL_001350080 [Klebsormidium nitens]|eukprot:GAQ83084.1 hypothetical protein KFL_001350080 [Klebsormidium nitens]